MTRSTNPPPSSDTTLKQELRGQELGDEAKVWKEIAASEARINLMKELQNIPGRKPEELGC